jgi:hypothetical protein
MTRNKHSPKFLDDILGARIAAPFKAEPVKNMPQAAPRTERPRTRPIPT